MCQILTWWQCLYLTDSGSATLPLTLLSLIVLHSSLWHLTTTQCLSTQLLSTPYKTWWTWKTTLLTLQWEGLEWQLCLVSSTLHNITLHSAQSFLKMWAHMKSMWHLTMGNHYIPLFSSLSQWRIVHRISWQVAYLKIKLLACSAITPTTCQQLSITRIILFL